MAMDVSNTSEDVGTDSLCHVGQKGNDIMLGFGFDGLYPLNGKTSFFSNITGSFLGDFTQLGERFAGQDLYLKPGLVLVFFSPYRSHGFSCIALNHKLSCYPLFLHNIHDFFRSKQRR
jgi:hypothetical protein